MNEMKKTTEDMVLQCFQTVSQYLAVRWSSILDYDDILGEAYMLYALKPDKWKKEYEANPENFRSYSFTVINNYLKSETARKRTKYIRYNYLCNRGTMEELLQSSWLDSIYQPTIDELRKDIRALLEGTAATHLTEAWQKITEPQRKLLQCFAERDDAITRAERKASDKFIMRVW